MGVPLSPEPEVSRLMLDAQWFARRARKFDETQSRLLILPEGNRLRVRLWCWNPSEYL